MPQCEHKNYEYNMRVIEQLQQLANTTITKFGGYPIKRSGLREAKIILRTDAPTRIHERYSRVCVLYINISYIWY